MNDFFSSIELYLSFAWWQSTVVLAAALAGSWFFRRFPWRAQTLLLLGVLGAGAVPGISIFCAEAGWGIFSSVPEMVAEPTRLEPTRLEPTRLEPAHFEKALAESDMVQPDTVPNEIGSETAQADAVQAETVFLESEPSTEILSHTQSSSAFLLERSKWLFWKGTVWGLAITGGLLMAMLVIGLFGSRVLLSRARPVADPAVQGQIEQVAEKLGRRRSPLLFTSDAVSGPTIWGWGIHPCLLFPKGMLEGVSSQARDAIFLHELAHLVRFDHVSSFLIQLLGCLLFWNPLYWLIRRRSELCSDQACDAIALYHAPIRPDSYADMIVQMAASRRRPAAFLFLSRKEKIMERVKNVLDFGQSPSTRLPRNSKLWTTTVVTLFLGTMLTIALMQERKAEAASNAEAESALAETTPFAWQEADDYRPPCFDSFFPDDPEGGAALDALWKSTDRDSRSDKEILETVRNGLRRMKGLRSNIIRWIGNRYVWNESPQNPMAIEIMYHAADFSGAKHDPYRTRHYAVYFGLSVVKEKTPAILHTLADLAMAVDDPNDLSRIAWGAKSQQNELIGYLQPYLDSEEKATREKADVVKRIFEGKLKAFEWAKTQKKERAQEKTFETVETVHLGPKPRPIKIEPPVGATDVDPDLKEIRITFDRDMDTACFAWCVRNGQHPKVAGKAKWIDSRTCVVPVKLEKGKGYFWLINVGEFSGFRSIDGVPSIPTPAYFCTKGASADLLKQMTPPEVVSLSVPNGATNVPPGRTRLSMTFDMPMSGHVYFEEGPDSPKFVDKAGGLSPDRKTRTMFADLKPGREYTIYLNSAKHQNYGDDFANKLGVSLKPYVWKFSTSGEPVASSKDQAETTETVHLGLNPRPIKIEPAVGAIDVDPGLKEIRVTFDRDMERGAHSWCGGGPRFPEITGKPKWIDARTCVLPVKLEEGQAYFLSLNTPRFEGFRSFDGWPVIPTPVYFCTKGASADLENLMTPPEVVSLSIPNGATGVQPGKTKLSVTFNVPMGNGMSWCSLSTAMKLEGSTWSEDRKTCTTIARLDPGHEFRISLNSPNHQGFRNELGLPLKPYLWTFSTSGEPSQTGGEFKTPLGDYTHLAIFKPVGDFDPQTPMELLHELHEKFQRVGGIRTGFFRTWPEDGRLVGGICTSTPDLLEKAIKENSDLQWISTDRLSRESFEKHEKRIQESMPGVFIAGGNHTHLTIFKPVGDFEPQTPMELLHELNKTLLKSKRVRTGWFRTWSEDGRLFGGICTGNPGGLEEVLEKIPELELVRTERLTKESFEKHESREQESMPGVFIAEGNHTHLTIFKPVGDFDPQTPMKLLQKLNKTLSKSKRVRTGWFRTWSEDGRLFGGICTGNPGGLEEVLEKIPELELVRTERLTKESFEKHESREQESMPGDLKAQSKHTHLTIFKPVGDFDPQTPMELFQKLTMNLTDSKRAWTGWFRTWSEDGRLFGGICTVNPKGLEEFLEKIPELELVRTERLTKESFEKHEKRKQESMPGIFITWSNYTHLTIFKPIGDFQPKTPKELFDELHATFHKVDGIRTGWFRAWQKDGRLVGGICTNTPDALKKAIEENSDLQWISTDWLTLESFKKHDKRRHKPLSGAPFIAQSKYTHLTIFKPVGDFEPKTPKELLEELHATFHKVGGIRTGWFRTWPEDGRLFGGICTSAPDALKKAIEENSELEWVSTDRLTKESFEKHEKRQQESLSGDPFVTERGYTHLTIFRPIGDFQPKTQKELLDKLHETYHKVEGLRTGWFFTWPEDGRLIGGICTNNPDGLKKVIEENPDLKRVSTERLTKGAFEKHKNRRQESMRGVSIPEVKYTHLAVFKSVGDFRPQRSQELLDELQESFQKTNQVRIGCFRTWPASGRLIGGICTNDPEGLGKVIEENPDLKLVTTRKLTKKLFERHSKRQSKSLE